MQGKTRPPATSGEAISRMDHYVALGLIGRQEVAQLLGLNVTDLTCLGHVMEAGDEPLSAGDLAALANLTTGAVTGVLNRLERAGYAKRQPDPADRRRVRVVADPVAARRVVEVYRPFYARLAALFDDYSPEEVAVIADWFARATVEARAHLDHLRSGEPPSAAPADPAAAGGLNPPMIKFPFSCPTEGSA
ncbi:MarR family transcriptional regulator [Streptomyces sp. BR123]|uniref:MarR family winged helix-turn-helix transcriptional regulator n=1 Tax=Streptomyces sp. BR123 TaxID=2749828 RepID=UPI0015C47C60|nr:MarR family transcriptional regulator [Streptomyces sp. BR123]NXY95701.1 MarR family transcriptional regulator [Streptomyces sp. BR123]